jgi:hypothetical protein
MSALREEHRHTMGHHYDALDNGKAETSERLASLEIARSGYEDNSPLFREPYFDLDLAHQFEPDSSGSGPK